MEEDKKIVEKALLGEDITEEVKGLDDARVAAINLAIRTEGGELAKKEIERLAGLRKAAKIVEGTPPAEGTFNMDTFRKEQVKKAKDRLLLNPEKYPMTEEEKVKFEELFPKLDTQKTDADNIFDDVETTYAAITKRNLLSAKEQISKFEKEADTRRSQGANAGGGSPAGFDPDKFSPGAKDLYKKWQTAGYIGPNYTIERAQTIASGGLERDLSK